MGYIFLVVSILFNIMSAILFKIASKSVELPYKYYIYILFGLMIAAVCSISYVKSLEKIDLSVVTPIYAGGSMILMLLVAALAFNENITFSKIVGTAIICFGIFIVSR